MIVILIKCKLFKHKYLLNVMDVPLLKKEDSKTNICFFIYIAMTIIGYTIMFIIIAININNIAINVNNMIEIINTIESKQYNATDIESIYQQLHTLTNCFYNKYCRRIPNDISNYL